MRKVAYEALQFEYQRESLTLPDGAPTADVVRNRGLTRRLAAYFLDHDARSYELISRVLREDSEGLTRDTFSTTSRSPG